MLQVQLLMAKRTSNSEHMEQEIRVEGLWVDLTAAVKPTAYHSNTYLTGRVKFEKDLKHTAGYSVESADAQKLNAVNTAAFKGGNWIGIKMVIYDIGNGSVKVEQWVDDQSNNIQPGNHWRKVLETTDHGRWGPTRGKYWPVRVEEANLRSATWVDPLHYLIGTT